MLDWMSRLIGALVVVALLAAPAVAQARMFCRYTGTETLDCAEQSVPEEAGVQQEGCCERRVVPALGVTHPRTADQLRAAPAPASVATGSIALELPVREPVRRQPNLAAEGPPLFLAQRALLI